MLGFPKPKHPLISLIDASQIEIREDLGEIRVLYDFYMIALKTKTCGVVEYGRNSYDFEEGVLVFSAPGQVFSSSGNVPRQKVEGWMLFFHADLIRNTHLGSNMDTYAFFNYDVSEALHMSEDEEKTIESTVANIKQEYEQRIDGHSQRVIVSNLELLLNYCLRFYERQFHTRSSLNKDVITQFEGALKAYFREGKHIEEGIPSIPYFADIANLSQHYFSDLIKKETGRKPKDHINDFIIEQAKNMLLATDSTVSEIAYDLGFNFPHYFTRLFKAKTGLSPVKYRSSN